MNPFFSIIVPAYNRAHFIGRCIDSVLEQVYENFELIIIDDGSIDNTQAVVERYSSKNINYIKIANSERGAARNVGIQAAVGDYITFLDSDDLLYANHLTKAKEIIEERRCPEIFRLAFEIKTPDGNVLEQCLVKGETVNKALIYGNILGCLGVFVKAEIIKKHLFVEDRKLAGTEDYELWLRLGSRYTIWNNNTVTAAIIQHKDRSVLKQDVNNLKERIHLFIKYVFSDACNLIAYGKSKRLFTSFRFSYISLHAVLSGDGRTGIKYLFKALLTYPLLISYKRFYVVLYKLLAKRKVVHH